MAKIAIIEDEQQILEMYKLKFEAEGFEVVTAKNGKEGLEIIKQSKPDLIMLDLMMPEMMGDAMLAELRKTDWGKNIKVIVMTNISEYEAPESLKDLGVENYIVKARYTPKQVTELVKNVLKIKSD